MEILANIFLGISGVSALVFTVGWTWIRYQKFQRGKPELWHKKLFLAMFLTMIISVLITFAILGIAQAGGHIETK